MGLTLPEVLEYAIGPVLHFVLGGEKLEHVVRPFVGEVWGRGEPSAIKDISRGS